MSDDVPEVLVWDCGVCGQKAVIDCPLCTNCGQPQPDDVELYPPEGSEEEKILLGLWDCTSCEGKGIPGDKYSCPDCGAGRPEDVEFYRPDDAQEITSAKGKAAAKAGADWQCEYCDQWVAAVLDTCPNCAGGEIETGKRQEVSEEVIDTEALHAAALTAIQAAEASAAATQPVAQPAQPAHPGDEEPGGSGLGCLVIAFVLAAFVCCAMFFFGGSTKVGVKVTGHTWKRVQQIENLQVVEASGWERPADAFDVREERKVHHVDKVKDGSRTVTKTVTEEVKVGEERYKAGVKRKDLGNGRFKEVPVYKKRPIYETQTKQVQVEEPIYKEVKRYQTHFRYKVKRWVAGDARERSGEGLEAEWPKTSVSGANQRLGEKSATYRVKLKATEGGSTYTFECDEERWRSLAVGSVWTAVMDGGEVEDLQPFAGD